MTRDECCLTPARAFNPSLPADWPGGVFCPCHGSTFNGAGRVFKHKPVTTNLEIPPYRFASDSRFLIGGDATTRRSPESANCASCMPAARVHLLRSPCLESLHL